MTTNGCTPPNQSTHASLTNEGKKSKSHDLANADFPALSIGHMFLPPPLGELLPYKKDGGVRHTFSGFKWVLLPVRISSLKTSKRELWRYLLGYWAKKRCQEIFEYELIFNFLSELIPLMGLKKALPTTRDLDTC